MKEGILKLVRNVRQDRELGGSFNCLGKIDDVYPELPQNILDYYRTWIWEYKDKSFRIATWDEGNGWCHYLCEGTPEALIKNLPLEV